MKSSRRLRFLTRVEIKEERKKKNSKKKRVNRFNKNNVSSIIAAEMNCII